jgi:hypothetical protein
VQIVRATADGLRAAQDVVRPVAEVEGLPLHAAALDRAIEAIDAAEAAA